MTGLRIGRRLRWASACWKWPWRRPVSSASLCVWVRRQWIGFRPVTRWAAAVPTWFPAALFRAALRGCVWIFLPPGHTLPLADPTQFSLTVQEAVEECAIVIPLLRRSWRRADAGRRWEMALCVPGAPPLFWGRKWTYVMSIFLVPSGMIFTVTVVAKLILIIVIMLWWTIPVRRITTDLHKFYLIVFIFPVLSPSASSLFVVGSNLLQLLQWASPSCGTVCLPL